MFSNVGWGEILLIFIVGLIVIGPERLPKVITDIRAMILAARTAIDDARNNLSNEFGEDFDDLRKPLQDLGELRKLNPKTAITRTLFDGDDTYLDMLSGKPAAGGGETAPQGQAPQNSAPLAADQSSQQGTASGAQWVDPVAQARAESAQQPGPAQPQPQTPAQPPAQAPAQAPRNAMNWVDDDVL